MFYTLTLNPAIDANSYAHDIKINEVNRTKNSHYSSNGKGINVSKVLKAFNIESKVLGLFGGFTGEYIIKDLKESGIDTIPVIIDKDTRINYFVSFDENEIKFVDEGPSIDRKYLNEIISIIEKLEDGDYLSINGSLPKNVSKEFYDEIFQSVLNKNINVILDISSSHLKSLLKYNPILIKPNFEELSDIFNFTLQSENDVIESLKTVNSMGAKNILLTDGENGMYFMNGNEIYKCNSPKINFLSSACCGDASLAAFLANYFNDETIENSLKYSAATGANVAEHAGIGPLDKVEDYIKKVKVEKIWQK